MLAPRSAASCANFIAFSTFLSFSSPQDIWIPANLIKGHLSYLKILEMLTESMGSCQAGEYSENILNIIGKEFDIAFFYIKFIMILNFYPIRSKIIDENSGHRR